MTYRSSRKGFSGTSLAAHRARRVRQHVSHVETLEVRALLSAAAGDLDTSWGNQGIVTTDFGSPDAGRGDLAMSVAIQSNGRIVSAGQSADTIGGPTVFAVSRHLADGTLDTGFGTNGTVLTDFGTNVNSLAQSVAVDSQQRILVAGRSGIGTGDVLSVARYLPDGTLDTSFGANGKATFPSLGTSVSDISLIVDDSGRPVIGLTSTVGNDASMLMARLNSNGFLDSGFGGGGVVVTDVGLVDIAGGIAIDGSGNVVQAGISQTASGVGRLISTRVSSSGSRDTQNYGNDGNGDFIGDGSVPMDGVKSVMVDADGTLLMAGFVNADNPNTGFPTGMLRLVRLAANGSAIADSATPGLNNDSFTWSMAVERDGKILIGGDDFSLDDFEQHYVIARFDGQLDQDTAFGDGDGTADGIYTSPINDSSASAIVADSQGQILVAGFAPGANDLDFFLARHNTAIVAGPPAVFADANARPDDAPYVVLEGQPLTLSGAGSVTVGGSAGVDLVGSQRRVVPTGSGGVGGEVNLAWDLDGDGEFDDATGPSPVLNGGALDGPSIVTVALKATDASNPLNFAVDSAQVQVNNVAPRATIKLPTVSREGELTTISATVVDVPADTFTYEWTLTQGNNVMTGNGAAFSFTPTDNGVWDVKLRVHDDDGGQVDAQPATLNVANVDPTAAIVAGTTNVSEGQTVSFTSNASDVDADPLTYQWTVKKNGSAFANAATQDFSFVPDDNGTYEVSLTVNDGDGGIVAATPVVVQASNLAPSPNITGDTLGVRGTQRTLTLAASDPGAADVTAGFTYTVNWADGSPVETFNPGTTTATHIYSANGTYAATVVAMDKDQASSQPFTISMVTQTAALDNGVLTIAGTSGDDKIRLFRTGQQVSVGVNDTPGGGKEFVQNYTGVNKIIINAGAGDDVVDGTEINVPMIVFGGPGADKITTGSGADIAVGGDGDDKIVGTGGARDILIGGRGSDKMQGDGGSDILVGGYTLHDADIVALQKIADEWNSSRSYNERVSNVHGDTHTGLNGNYYIKPDVTTFDDGAVDNMSGGAGQDWFVFNSDKGDTKDKVTDASGNEILEDVDMQP